MDPKVSQTDNRMWNKTKEYKTGTENYDFHNHNNFTFILLKSNQINILPIPII
jgi:hypothetical protein